MINASNDNCQQIMNNDDTDLSVSNLDDATELRRAADHSTPIPVVTTCFMAMPEALTNIDSSKAVSSAIAAVIRYNNSPEIKAKQEAKKALDQLIKQNAEIDEWRKGEGREHYNGCNRAAYAVLIEETEGRGVRAYINHESDEARATARQEQNKTAQKKRTASMTPAQKKEASRKRQLRREKAKKRKQQALIDQALF